MQNKTLFKNVSKIIQTSRTVHLEKIIVANQKKEIKMTKTRSIREAGKNSKKQNGSWSALLNIYICQLTRRRLIIVLGLMSVIKIVRRRSK